MFGALGFNFAILSCLAELVWGESVYVETKHGRLEGTRRIEHYNIGPEALTDVVDEFLGVPYAGPVAGKVRFQPPRHPGKWEGVRRATAHGPTCPQVPYYTQTADQLQSENCLNMNIFVPVTGENLRPYPVMMFIHGGSYEEGSGNRYDGFTLAQHGVIVTCINYRLGELGYLTTGDARLPGNYGLLDQIQALKWIQDNIHSFHGDSSTVTVFGSSAGASSIGLLLLAPAAEGLFHRAVLQSGSPLASWALYNHTSMPLERFVKVVAEGVGCSDKLPVGIDCLRNIPHKNISDSHWRLPGITPSHLNFKPLVDGVVLPDYPEVLFRNGLFHNVSLMIGNVKEEWSRSMGWFFNDIIPPEIDTNFTDGFERISFERAVRHVLTSRFLYPDLIADIAIHAYTDWDKKDDPIINRENYLQMMSDMLMIAPSVQLANLMRPTMDVYYYMYEHASHLTQEKWWQTYHSLELDSVFGSPFTGYDIATDAMANYTEEDRNLSRQIMKLWTNFAKYGHPTPKMEETNQTKWAKLAVGSTKINHLYISANTTHSRNSLRSDKMHIWNNLIPKLLLENKCVCNKNMSEQEHGGHTGHQDERLFIWILVFTTCFLLAILLFVCFRKGRKSTKEGKIRKKPYQQVPTNGDVK